MSKCEAAHAELAEFAEFAEGHIASLVLAMRDRVSRKSIESIK